MPKECHNTSAELELFSIGDTCDDYGVTYRTIRYYEDKGLISPLRRGGVRLYSNEDRKRLETILRAKQLGFTILEISEMLQKRGNYKDDVNFELNLTPQQLKSQINLLEKRRSEIDYALAALENAYLTSIQDLERTELPSYFARCMLS